MPDSDAKLKLAPVVVLPTISIGLDVDVERVLAGPVGKLQEVVIVGITHEGDFYFASSKCDGPNVLWALEKAKMELLNVSTN